MSDLQRAAHVDCPIVHTSGAAREAGMLLASAVTIYFSGGASLLVTLGRVATAISISKDVGGVVDSASDRVASGKIVTGYDHLLLGPQIKKAARASSDDTTVDCDAGAHLAEGSETVLIGPDSKPFSRRNDRTECDGIVADGLPTLLVGGAPSAEGVDIPETDPTGVQVIGGLGSIASSIKSFGTHQGFKGAMKALGAALDATGHHDAANVAKALGSSPPKNWAEYWSTTHGVEKGVVSGVHLTTP